MRESLSRRLEALGGPRRELFLRRLAELRAKRLAERPRAPAAMTVEQLEAEAHLDPAIEPGGAPAPASGSDAEAVLLTGATGFLGSFLLGQLLGRTRAVVYCLVRAPSAEAGRARIEEAALSYQLGRVGSSSRVVPVVGDLGQPRLGLPPRQFVELAHKVSAVHHCAAVVNWIYPFAALRTANVFGTQEALRLAATGPVKPLHFISTVGVFSSPDREGRPVMESDDLATSGTLHVGYAQSKWVAERLVRKAGERGLPITVFRPNIAGHSVTGAFNRNDHLCAMIKGCIQLGLVPDLDLRINGAPVDFVSAAIVHLSTLTERPGDTFHLVNADGIGWRELWDAVRSFGYPVREVSFPRWKAGVLATLARGRRHALFGFAPFLSEGMLERSLLPAFDCRQALAGLRGSGIASSRFDGSLVHTYLEQFVREGYLQKPPG